MKGKMIIILTVLILLISGCGDKDAASVKSKETKDSDKILKAKADKINESEKKSSEEVDEKNVYFSLKEIFPYEKNFTWNYEGALDYGRYETIMNVEETLADEKAKYIYIEGNVDDLSGGEAGDLSFVKKYRITEEAIELIYDENNSIPILKAPLKKGSSWTGTWIDSMGLFTARLTIIEVTDKEITTELVPEKPNEDGVDNRYKIITKYEIGKGIVSAEIFYPQEDSGTYEFPIRLYKTSLTASDTIISKYVDPSEGLKKFYQHDNMWYEIVIAKEKQWANSQKNDLDDEKIISRYKTLLESLSKNDLKSISLAKKAGEYYCELVDETASIIHLFEKFYEDTIAYLKFKFIDENSLSYLEAEKIFYYDKEKGVFMNKLSLEDPLLMAKALVFYENGVTISYEEGLIFLCPDMNYVSRNFKGYASDLMKDYLELKRWRYKNTPFVSDAALTVTWDELADYIGKLEKFYNKYFDTDEAKWAKEEAKELFVLYAVPINMDNSSKYRNGILSSDVRESYERFIEDHRDSDYGKKIEKIYGNLKENQFIYNGKLEEILKEFGFQPQIDKRMSNRIKEYEKQLEDFKKIISKAVEEPRQDDGELEVITVETVNELINAIGPNRKILVKPSIYIFPYEFSSKFVDVIDGEVNINNVSNLIIEGLGENPVTLLSEAYGYVLSFPGCENISLINLRMGHTNEFCKAGVIKFGGKNIMIDRCILFGCGEWGITTSGVVNMKVINTLISDCVTQAATLYESKEIIFNNCIFTRNGRNVVFIQESEDILFKEVDIIHNTKENYDKRDGIFYIEKSKNIGIDSCTIKENGTEKLSEGDTELSIVE